jgi:two-component sensor histidine kinase
LPNYLPTVWDVQNLRRANLAAGVALWSWHVADDHFSMDEVAFVMWGLPHADRITFDEMSTRIHPSDHDRVRAAFNATLGVEGAYEIDFRIIVDDKVRWVSARGIGNGVGMHDGIVFGIFLDVTGRKQAEEGSELLAGEMSHRVKNLLALATGLTNMASRSSMTKEEMAKDLTGRLASLGRAHDLVRPLPGGQGTAALLGDLVAVLLQPYDDTGAFKGRIRVAVPRMGIGEGAATTLALVVHELATNSLKYGALSTEAGTLDVSGSNEGEFVKLVWRERGGPAVARPESREGYGSRLLERSVIGQLGGAIEYDWSPAGVSVNLALKVAKLAI